MLVGPSGCGKSTLLRMIAGLEEITAGEIAIGGRVVNDLEPRDRGIAMVFQNYALYPHMTVPENIGYRAEGRRRPGGRDRARAVARPRRSLELGDFLDRKPAAAVGRPAPARGDGPRDRPRTRRSSCSTNRCRTSTPSCASRCAPRSGTLQRRLGTTSIYVTHDQVEAMTLADRIVVMNKGRVRADRHAAGRLPTGPPRPSWPASSARRR